ncbi:MAG: response regulator [Bacteroidota bacterium]
MQYDDFNVLLADDDPDDRLFFKYAMEELKIKTIVTTVNDGVDLMNHLKQTDVVLPHVVFLDLNMPRKGGMECLKEIRSDKKFKDLSIAIYSTSGSDKDIEESFVLGANIYIKKPNDFNSLKKILAEVININWQYHTSGLNKENFVLSI